ncbi:MAG: sulfatase, partial [Acidobacteriota bacterium]
MNPRTTPPRSARFRPALIGAAAGLFAGLLNLALDAASTAATLGFPLPLEAWHVMSYAVCGSVLGAVAGLGCAVAGWSIGRRRGSRRFSWATVVTALLGVMQVAALIERVWHALVARVPIAVVAVAAVVVAAGYFAWVFGLRWLLRGEAPWALALEAITSSLGLAMNRNVVDDVFSKPALVADGAIVVAVAAAAFILGRAGSRRVWVALAGLALAFAGAFLAHRPTVAKEARGLVDGDKPPHLVLVIIDTLRRDVFESVLAETDEGQRFLEALGGAAFFDRVAAAAPWTAPSVASIMTGLWPPEHGYGYQEKMTRDLPLTRLSTEVRPLSERLKARGYQTAAWVANPVLGAASGLDRGFDRFELLNGATSKLPLLTVLERLGFFEQDLYLDASSVRRRLAAHLPTIASDPRPAFLWIHLMDPHLPFKRHPSLPPDGAGVTGDERLYRDEVRFAVSQVAVMIELLKARGIFEDAVFAVVSDHGEMFPSDGHGAMPPNKPKLYGHGHALYESLMHVPLILRPPGGLTESRRVDALASHVDLLSTFADLLRLDLRQPTVDRYSLAPWLSAEPPENTRPFALLGANHIGKPQRGLQSARHKLIVYDDPRLRTQLFDL